MKRWVVGLQAVALAVFVGACGADGDTDTHGTSDIGADTGLDVPADTSGDEIGVCSDAPVLVWANFADGFLTTYCQPCHASTAPDRFLAPETVNFDTLGDAQMWAPRIRARALSQERPMPPGGGVPPDDLELLELWLDCSGPEPDAVR